MKKITLIEEYIEESHFYEALNVLHAIIIKTGLQGTIKWNAPIYELNGEKILGIGAFKNHFGIWFFNGVFLKDKYKLLIAAQEKTKALRQMRFTSINEINPKIIAEYINEAIENHKQGKILKAVKTKKELEIPEILKIMLESNEVLHTSFYGLAPYKRREFCEYITEAKRDATKQSRLEKITPLILDGVGLNDSYKK